MDKSDFKNAIITLYVGEIEKGKIKTIDYTETNSNIMDEYYRNSLISLIINNFEIVDFVKCNEI